MQQKMVFVKWPQLLHNEVHNKAANSSEALFTKDFRKGTQRLNFTIKGMFLCLISRSRLQTLLPLQCRESTALISSSTQHRTTYHYQVKKGPSVQLAFCFPFYLTPVQRVRFIASWGTQNELDITTVGVGVRQNSDEKKNCLTFPRLFMGITSDVLFASSLGEVSDSFSAGV